MAASTLRKCCCTVCPLCTLEQFKRKVLLTISGVDFSSCCIEQASGGGGGEFFDYLRGLAVNINRTFCLTNGAYYGDPPEPNSCTWLSIEPDDSTWGYTAGVEEGTGCGTGDETIISATQVTATFTLGPAPDYLACLSVGFGGPDLPPFMVGFEAQFVFRCGTDATTDNQLPCGWTVVTDCGGPSTSTCTGGSASLSWGAC